MIALHNNKNFVASISNHDDGGGHINDNGKVPDDFHFFFFLQKSSEIQIVGIQ
mgnify:CR=1 FL=1